jgi:hypothetical protein
MATLSPSRTTAAIASRIEATLEALTGTGSIGSAGRRRLGGAAEPRARSISRCA